MLMLSDVEGWSAGDVLIRLLYGKDDLNSLDYVFIVREVFAYKPSSSSREVGCWNCYFQKKRNF